VDFMLAQINLSTTTARGGLGFLAAVVLRKARPDEAAAH
jgi:hypothetical protein